MQKIVISLKKKIIILKGNKLNIYTFKENALIFIFQIDSHFSRIDAQFY